MNRKTQGSLVSNRDWLKPILTTAGLVLLVGFFGLGAFATRRNLPSQPMMRRALSC